MSSMYVVLYFLLVFEGEFLSFQPTDTTRNGSIIYPSEQDQPDEGIVTETAGNTTSCDYNQSLTIEGIETDVGNPPCYNKNSSERNHTASNTSEPDTTDNAYLTGFTFKLCERRNLCRVVCNGSKRANVNTLSLSFDGQPMGNDDSEPPEVGKLSSPLDGQPIGNDDSEPADVGKFSSSLDGQPIGNDDSEPADLGKFSSPLDGQPIGNDDFEPADVGKFSSPLDGQPIGNDDSKLMGLSDGDFNDTILFRRRKDAGFLDRVANGDGLNDPAGINRREMPGVQVRLERAAEENDEEISESGTGQLLPEDTCTAQGLECSCDKYCVIFRDCCVDAFEYWSGQNETTELIHLIKNVTLRTSVEGNVTSLAKMLESNPGNEQNVINNALLTFASCENMSETVHGFIISRCPSDGADASLREKCEQETSPLLPRIVAALPQGSVVFKNVFCAQCHGIATSFLTPWTPVVKCNDTSTEVEIKALTLKDLIRHTKNGTCSLTYENYLDKYHSRFCKPGTHFQKNTTNIDNRDDQCSEIDNLLCQAYYFPSDDYKNPHCQICQGPGNLSGQVIFIENCGNNTFTVPPNPGILVILDISGRFSQGGDGQMYYFCKDEEVFDPLTFDCKMVICSLGQTPYRGLCVDSADVFVPSSSQLFQNGWTVLQITSTIIFPAASDTCAKIHLIFHDFVYNIDKLINIREGMALPPSFQIFPIGQCKEYNNNTGISVRIVIEEPLHLTREFTSYMLRNLTSSVTEYLLGDLHNFTHNILFTNMVYHNTYERACQDGYNLTQRKDFELTESNGETYALINFTKQRVYYSLNNIGFQIAFIAGESAAPDSVSVVKTVFVCEKRKLFSDTQCSSVVSYWLNETNQEGTTLKILKSNQIYEGDKFVIRGNEVFVCSNFASAFDIYKTPLVNSIFTLFVTLISIIFLSIMLSLYFLFPELLTLPGKLTACLAATLMMTFIFSIVPLTSLKHEIICAVLAAVNHLVTLAYFWWMSSIAFNMAWTFGPNSNSLVKSINDKEAFRGFSIFVWGVSAAIVLPAVILDIVHRRGGKASADTPQNNTPQEAESSDLHSPPGSTDTPEFPMYGKANCVWFSAPLWARLTFVLVPYFISFIITVTGFAVTLIGLRRSSKISERVGKGSSERTLCLIYIKLSTALGFSWILSIVIGFYPDNLELQYIYTGLTLLQGGLLFLAFMANKRVYALIRQRMRSTVSRGSQKTTSSNTASTAYTD